ncbi:hypothetical protein TIN4_69 [Tsukamurella phage TIN4]|uniref:Uncharacterized protein n=2 Tax=Tinduovirus TIN3 TaxID=1982571 RepID=A0A0K0N5I8_9CAUD|nr:hypothetical protein AVT54_gp056 [Tsukamurella phage TIN3]YP_009604199.1 hypothetical protein FDH87_gp056 [Tsukamurella phage TIN4]AKJ71866.1 hypothetical protein TIN3_69 [Tsukamurella phage TIN3]AKJ71975.1 hypothetical protein TIN4_69 [Tsukamurella phage TIN4]
MASTPYWADPDDAPEPHTEEANEVMDLSKLRPPMTPEEEEEVKPDEGLMA